VKKCDDYIHSAPTFDGRTEKQHRDLHLHCILTRDNNMLAKSEKKSAQFPHL